MCGDKEQVKEFGKRFQRETFPCNYQERKGKHDSMILTITPPLYETKEYRQYQSEYSKLAPNLSEGDELLKMEIIHILEDQGFKIINTMCNSNGTFEKLMLYKELQQRAN